MPRLRERCRIWGGRGHYRRRRDALYVIVDDLAHVLVFGDDRDLDSAILLVGTFGLGGVERAEHRVGASGKVAAVRIGERLIGFEEVIEHGGGTLGREVPIEGGGAAV